MKATAWGWLVLLLIPGCILVQPLDEAKPADSGSAGSSGKPAQTAGSNGSTAGSGSGNKAGSGPGGAANGGAPSGVDFSLFTGTWILTSGENTTICDGGTPQTEDAEVGGEDTVGLGTSSDLIFGPGSSCEILADVDDHTASLNSDTLTCSYSDSGGDYDVLYDSFDFVVSSNGLTASASIATTVLFTDVNSELHYCEVSQSLNYNR